MRFTLLKLLLAVAILALACAGMTNLNRWWLSGIVTLTIAVYSVAVLEMIASQGRQRAALLGFCAMGFGYFLLVSNLFFGSGKWLLTNVPIAWVARAMQLGVDAPVPAASGDGTNVISGPTVPPLDVYIESVMGGIYYTTPVTIFFVIAQCVWSWLFAVLGAWFVGRMYDWELRDFETTELSAPNP
jgi:hypothetical protein